MEDLKNTNEALRKFAKSVIKSARQNLTKKKKNVSSRLYDSLDYNLKASGNSFSLSFLMETYGMFQDRGVDGTQKKYTTVGKVKGLREEFGKRFSYRSSSNLIGLEHKTGLFGKWLKAKGIRLRDKSGQYVSYKQGGFMVAINKKKFGIKPSLFFTRPFSTAFQNLPEELVNAYGLDVDNLLQFTLTNVLDNKE